MKKTTAESNDCIGKKMGAQRSLRSETDRGGSCRMSGGAGRGRQGLFDVPLV